MKRIFTTEFKSNQSLLAESLLNVGDQHQDQAFCFYEQNGTRLRSFMVALYSSKFFSYSFNLHCERGSIKVQVIICCENQEDQIKIYSLAQVYKQNPHLTSQNLHQ